MAMSERGITLFAGISFYVLGAICLCSQAFDFDAFMLVVGLALVWIGEQQLQELKKQHG